MRLSETNGFEKAKAFNRLLVLAQKYARNRPTFKHIIMGYYHILSICTQEMYNSLGEGSATYDRMYIL